MPPELLGPACASLPDPLDREQRAAAGGNARARSFYAAYGKRAFDLAVALPALLALGPVMLLVALAVLVADGRPVVFRHVRLGRDMKPFLMVKFRTMRPDAAKLGPITTAGDPRVTRLGAVLRRHKLDELLQLWNVVTGEMSLVGPRPDVPGYLDRLGSRFDPVRRLRPGITGAATLALAREEKLLAEVADPVAFNDDVLFPLKSELNLAYAQQMSFGHDLVLLARTILRRDAFALDLAAVRKLALAHGLDAAAG